MYNILVCDDEKDIVSALTIYLSAEGYHVFPAYNGEEAMAVIEREDIHLALLDVMMPVMDGITTLTELRRSHNLPVILLTAKSEDTDKLIGFEYGADDYITKPFNILELKARVRALLRRSSIQTGMLEKSQMIEADDIRLDTGRRAAFKAGVEVDLTLKEYDLAELFMRSPGKVYSRENLLDMVWGYDFQGDVRTVDVHIRRLREKLETDPANPAHFFTKWGVGYYFK